MVRSAAKGIAIQSAGWVLVALGLAAIFLPGPGLLMLFAGMALLATQYAWAERRLGPVRRAAVRGAADSVATPLRIAMSVVVILGLIAMGIVWGLRPPAPSWWPVDDKWWLFGGWGPGATLIVSALIAGGTLVYSFRNFRDIKVDQADTPQEKARAARDAPGTSQD